MNITEFVIKIHWLEKYKEAHQWEETASPITFLYTVVSTLSFLYSLGSILCYLTGYIFVLDQRHTAQMGY